MLTADEKVNELTNILESQQQENDHLRDELERMDQERENSVGQSQRDESV